MTKVNAEHTTLKHIFRLGLQNSRNSNNASLRLSCLTLTSLLFNSVKKGRNSEVCFEIFYLIFRLIQRKFIEPHFVQNKLF